MSPADSTLPGVGPVSAVFNTVSPETGPVLGTRSGLKLIDNEMKSERSPLNFKWLCLAMLEAS